MTTRVSAEAPPGPVVAAGPECSQCHGRMTVRQVYPMLRETDCDEVVYGCALCGTDVKRVVKRT